MRPRSFVLLISLVVGSGAIVTVTPAAACAAAPPRIYLGGFPPEAATRPLYWAAEPDTGTANASFTIIHTGGCGATLSVDYRTQAGTATPGAGADYDDVVGTSTVQVPGDDAIPDTRSVPVHADPDTESIVEAAGIVISNPRSSGGIAPSLGLASVPLFIVDADGVSRTGFAESAYSQSESQTEAKVPVFRAGDSSAPASVGYTLGPGPSNPATAGADYQATSPGTLSFGPGERLKSIDLTIVNDELGEGPEDIAITLAGGGSATFTILDNEESEPPSSRLHHPRHRWKYKKSDYRIREVHVFATDTGGAGVTAAQFSLRRNMKNGDCLWLTKEGWQKKECTNRQWLATTYDQTGLLWYYRPKQLKSSVGTKIKDYTAYSRAIDGAGNVEKDFTEKRNANTFEVKRRRRR